jgi:tripartite-type tricarboxylate transporter receptor subunit TctC
MKTHRKSARGAQACLTKCAPAAAIAIGALLALPAAAKDGSVAEFYHGKTMTMMIGTVAGGEYDLHARLIARHIGKHIPGNPTVVAQNMTGGGGVVMANYLYNIAPKDGTYIAVLNKALPSSQAMGERSLKFDTAKMFWLGAIAPTTETMVVWRTTGVKTLDDARRKEVVIGTTGKENITYMFPRLLNELIGTRFKLITGYRGGSDINVAMERGEVGGRQNTWSSWKSTKPHWLKSGDIVPIVQGGETAKDLPGVPNVEDLAKSEDDKRVFNLVLAGSRLGRPIVTTPGVPPERVKALRDAFDATMQDPAFLASCKDAKVEIDPVAGVKLQAIVSQVLSTPQGVAKRTKELLN